ncbi:hypothetical protein EC844_1324 [Acinetobacter calcoaceticus]|uniref:Hydrolase n=1 Tax=Acinetobacter calcoaceticus TaxID=471 RepID=A0A4R1XA03_ACICA|nr:hypothetical protein EC844_1324 [Acinetobacter calcoaceticus]
MTESIFLSGLAGKIHVYVDHPEGPVKGFALVCHPHPLIGGTPQHKVPTLLAQLLAEQGCVVYRPNFRGVAESDGRHDDGFGETEDMLAVIEQLHQRHAGLPFYAAGFSFGSHVIGKCQARLTEAQRPRQMILCGLPTADVDGLRRYDTPAIQGDLLLIHGELDNITLLEDLMLWARPQRHLVTVLPGANHYFTGYLNQLRLAISRFLKVRH